MEKYLPRRFKTIQDRHVNIENNQIRLQQRALIYSFLPIGGLAADFPAVLGFQQSAHHAPDVLVIIND
jgi:hypothetical protein